MKTEKIMNFEKLVSEDKSGWIEKANWRKSNQDWLDKSALIAIKVLRTIRAKNISQKDLAVDMGVSAQYINKIVKGSENLSLETISKLETALNIKLIEIIGINSSINYNIPKSIQLEMSVSPEINETVSFMKISYSKGELTQKGEAA